MYLNSWPIFSIEEANTVRDVLLSNQVNYWSGTNCLAFEKEFAEWCGTQYAVSLTNGTLALEAALSVLCIGPGDEVIVTPRIPPLRINSGAVPRISNTIVL